MKVRRGPVAVDFGPHRDWLLHDPSEGERQEARRTRARRSNLRQYGLSEDEYQVMLAAQDDVCAVCRRPERMARLGTTRRLVVDRDPTGRVRGLVCHACHVSLREHADPRGFLAWAERAADYLLMALHRARTTVPAR